HERPRGRGEWAGLLGGPVRSDSPGRAGAGRQGRRDAARRGARGQGCVESRRGALAGGGPRVRAAQLLPALRHRGPEGGHGRLRRETQAELGGTLMGGERDLGRDLADEPEPAWRDTAPDILSPIDENAPVSGHQPPPPADASPAAAPEHDWTSASDHVYPVLRPAGTHGTMLAEIDD